MKQTCIIYFTHLRLILITHTMQVYNDIVWLASFFCVLSYCFKRFYFLLLWNNNNRFVIIIQQTLLKLDCRHYGFRPLDTRQGTRPSRCPRCCTRSGLPYSSYHLYRCWPTCPLLKLMVNFMSCDYY